MMAEDLKDIQDEVDNGASDAIENDLDGANDNGGDGGGEEGREAVADGNSFSHEDQNWEVVSKASSSEASAEDLGNTAQVKEEPEPIDPNIWTLPADKDVCTLEEIRRGQVINNVASNECPVMGCGKKINEANLEPPPGTIASGLRTHVLFVHYANRKGVKKRKLGWSNKRRSSASPKKQYTESNMRSSPMMNWPEPVEYDVEPENFTLSSNDMIPPISSGMSLINRNYDNHNRNSPPGSLLNKKIKQLSAGQQQSSLQSLIQATGMGFPSNNGNKFSPQTKQKGQDLSANQKNFNQTTSSLFSILAGLTQQPQQQQQNTPQRPHLTGQSQQSSLQRNMKAAHSGNTISVSQCSKNTSTSASTTTNNNFMTNQPINSSLLTLLNEKISGNVASALQSQLKKNLDSNSNNKVPTNHYNQQKMSNHDNNNYNNGSSILNSLCSGNGDLRLPHTDNPTSALNQFIESVARKTSSNIGPAGVAEVKKIIEKFTSWLICSSQTIADHYIAPFAGEAPQQKPEISASDVILAYKMMQKSHPQ